MAPNFETPRDTLGSDAADALENHRYRRLEVEVDRDEVVIRKTIASGALPDERYPLAEARAALSASGIEEHLDANGPVMPTKMAIAIETMAKHRQTGVLYDSDRPETTDQIAFPNKHFEPGWKPITETLAERKPTVAGGNPSIGTPKRPTATVSTKAENGPQRTRT